MLTPTRTDPGRVERYGHFRRAGLSWSDADLDAVAGFQLARPEPVVDTRRAACGHHEADGLHLTPYGQRAVPAALLETLHPERSSRARTPRPVRSRIGSASVGPPTGRPARSTGT
ncbi:hypothetical protein [Streptomyces sp. DSM 40907]|uniref:hypothetical protein n=1 Tax=Streptomyces kutzneri TaxID=3051179 RepID=UPI0028D2A2A4|nr:hypothetical protein [Streptomyces sp. DSM 40907]